LPGALIEQDGTKDRVRGGELRRVGPLAHLVVEFRDDVLDGPGVVLAGLRQRDVLRPDYRLLYNAESDYGPRGPVGLG
jgi:hypothetical protein